MHPVVIITKNGGYLVGVPYTDTLMVRWSVNKYDAAQFRRRRIARRVADRVGGRVVIFNPLNGNITA